ncbi:MAG: hypothetical protein NC548_65795 [Lachnospiraceae bacterium]|nr:hypothetical protein [Lachnospiraceae bacterium]
MSASYGSIIRRDIPYVYAISIDELDESDIYRLWKMHCVKREDFVLVKHSKECIVINKALGEKLKEVEDIINKVMQSEYLPEKLLNRFSELTDGESSYILMSYFLDWRDELKKRDLYRQAMSILKTAKSLRISWKVKRNRQIIKELFDIGYGLYEKEAICDYQQGAENAFMYGYLLGVQTQKGGTA